MDINFNAPLSVELVFNYYFYSKKSLCAALNHTNIDSCIVEWCRSKFQSEEIDNYIGLHCDDHVVINSSLFFEKFLIHKAKLETMRGYREYHYTCEFLNEFEHLSKAFLIYYVVNINYLLI